MYGAVMFAEMMRSAIKGEVDEEDTKIVPEDFKTFMRRVDRMVPLNHFDDHLQLSNLFLTFLFFQT